MATDAGKLLRSPELRREMGRRARESAVTRYRTDLVIPHYIKFYEQILSRGKE
jgi:glycosyltransferase involved in cell wall biosynthesis